MVVVAAGGDERGFIAVALLQLEAEHADVEAERTVEVGDLQVHVPDVDAGVEAHGGDDSGSRDRRFPTVVAKRWQGGDPGGGSPSRRFEA